MVWVVLSNESSTGLKSLRECMLKQCSSDWSGGVFGQSKSDTS